MSGRGGATIQVVIGALIVLTGAVWMLQGIGVLGGSAMTDQSQWVVIGAIAVAIGAVLAYRGLKARRELP